MIVAQNSPNRPEISHHKPRLQKPNQLPLHENNTSRRLMHSHIVSISTLTLSFLWGLSDPTPAAASLIRLPASSLQNTYILVRAAESQAESEGYLLTNPVSKTSITSGLSPKGKTDTIQKVWPALKEPCGASGCWIWPSMTQRCYQTAEIIASLAGIARNRIVPEFSFLDARGVGALDRGQPSTVEALLRQGEQGEGDGSSGGGAYWKPPKGSDGTPNESLSDVLVRMTQLLSLLETQYNGENVVIISPDSDNLSVLQAAVVGGSEDLTQHYKWAFQPGEVRLLQLSDVEFDDSPRSIPCPNPPQCR